MSDSPTLSVTLLGAGQEVGRSCCVLKYRGKTVVCDAGSRALLRQVLPSLHSFQVSIQLTTGWHLSHSSMNWIGVPWTPFLLHSTPTFTFLYPFFPQIHSFSFHLDHAASLTYI